MKNKIINTFILLTAILVLAGNVALFYIPHIRGEYTILHTSDERLQTYLKGEDYLEIYFNHDYWKSTEDEYHTMVREGSVRETSEKRHVLTNKNNQIKEEIVNDDITMITTIDAINSQNFRLRRSYEIKNEKLLEDLDTIYTQIIIGSDFYSYTKEQNRLNFLECNITIEKPENVKIDYFYAQDYLRISQEIHEEMKEHDTFNINLNFSIDCE